MVSDWTKLYNTLLMIKTEGESTKIMADCLRFVEQKMLEEANQQTAIAESGEE